MTGFAQSLSLRIGNWGCSDVFEVPHWLTIKECIKQHHFKKQRALTIHTPCIFPSISIKWKAFAAKIMQLSSSSHLWTLIRIKLYFVWELCLMDPGSCTNRAAGCEGILFMRALVMNMMALNQCTKVGTHSTAYHLLSRAKILTSAWIWLSLEGKAVGT